MSSRSGEVPTVKKRMVRAAIEEMLAVDEIIEIAEEQRVSGGVPIDIRKTMHSRVFGYYRAVKRCVDLFPQASEEWEEKELERFEEWRGEDYEIQDKKPGRGGQQFAATRAAPLDFGRLEDVSNNLDEVTTKLAEQVVGLSDPEVEV